MSSVSFASWAALARQDEYGQSEQHQLAITALESLFSGHTLPSATAARLGAIYDSFLKEKEGESIGLWGLVCDVIVAFGSDLSFADRLIQLIDALGDLPPVTDHNGKTIKTDGREWWHQLPNLGWMLREYAFEWYALGMEENFVQKRSKFLQNM